VFGVCASSCEPFHGKLQHKYVGYEPVSPDQMSTDRDLFNTLKDESQQFIQSLDAARAAGYPMEMDTAERARYDEALNCSFRSKQVEDRRMIHFLGLVYPDIGQLTIKISTDVAFTRDPRVEDKCHYCLSGMDKPQERDAANPVGDELFI
jgi:hypothetical protein